MTDDQIALMLIKEETLVKMTELQNSLLQKIVDRNIAHDKKQEIILANARVVAANSAVLLEGISNPGFNRMRLFMDAQFSAQTNGLEAEIIYRNSAVEQILVLKASNGSAGMYSEPIDITQVPALSIQVKNRDTGNSTKFNAKVILYNK